jgi:hypothetical protein
LNLEFSIQDFLNECALACKALFNKFFFKMQFDTVVPSHLPVELSSTKPPSGRSRSIRKRKFESQDDFQKDQEFQQMAKRSKIVDIEGPFWFEEGTVEIGENNEKIQHGITNRERQLLKEIVKTNF